MPALQCLCKAAKKEKRELNYKCRVRNGSAFLFNHPYQTVKHVYNLLKRVCNWAIRRELYSGLNPCVKARPLKFDNRISNPLSRLDMERLIDVLELCENQRGAQVVRFALYTGKRRGKILAPFHFKTAPGQTQGSAFMDIGN